MLNQFSMFFLNSNIARHAVEKFSSFNIAMFIDMIVNQVHHANDGQRTDLRLMGIINPTGDIAVGIYSLKMDVLINFFKYFMDHFL
jgi:hypothetical protein